MLHNFILPFAGFFLYVGLLGAQSLLLNNGHTRYATIISAGATWIQLKSIKQIVFMSDYVILAAALGSSCGILLVGKVFWKYKGKLWNSTK